MPSTVKGPAIFLAQFAGDSAPFNSWKAICGWAAGLGYKGVQIPTWDGRLFDLAKAAASKAYCDEVSGIAREQGIAITELSTHLQGQLVAVNPVFDEAFDAFAPESVHGKPQERQDGPSSNCTWPPRLRSILGSRPPSASPARWRGRSLIRGRRARPASSKGLLRNSRGVGSRSLMPMTTSVAMSATKSIPARTCSTAPLSRCSSPPWRPQACLHQL